MTTASFQIQLQAGWNIIGNPYAGNVLLENTQVKQGAGGILRTFDYAVTNNWIGNALYEYNGNTYTFKTYNLDPKAVLTPFVGYWIYVKQTDATYYLVVTKP